MKRKLFTGIVLLLAVAACNQNQKKPTAEYPTVEPMQGSVDSDVKELKLTAAGQCYTATLKKDSAFLSLKKVNDKVTGKLWYKFAEKDNTKGDLQGTMDKDTLKLNYTYSSEGKDGSKMPVNLLYKNGSLYEVYNGKPVEENNGFIYIVSDCKEF
ncbi:hypothetical protein I5M32_11100 [Pedobacter sp. SD-b]|uniref:NlpE N-terminal domain-containing protein n=1 Tax=Pedobacter segetis TaxID=2793069 RepID=A0ABS1BKU1_9SPHI|nr:hypothetical protein [Pedobacter segetis]MBK0383504.1 hypothetical protein [Pedobacter segetis]